MRTFHPGMLRLRRSDTRTFHQHQKQSAGQLISRPAGRWHNCRHTSIATGPTGRSRATNSFGSGGPTIKGLASFLHHLERSMKAQHVLCDCASLTVNFQTKLVRFAICVALQQCHAIWRRIEFKIKKLSIVLTVFTFARHCRLGSFGRYVLAANSFAWSLHFGIIVGQSPTFKIFVGQFRFGSNVHQRAKRWCQ